MAIRTLYMPLLEMTDEQLVVRSQEGDDLALEELLRRYRRFARSKARTYFLVGADADDIEQEGLIGLYKAARDFRPERTVNFRAFAELCVTRQVISAVKAATRMKHQPLNRYVSISGTRGGDDAAEQHVETLLEGHNVSDPCDEVVARERHDAVRAMVAGTLSTFEVDVLRLYIEGTSYSEISEKLGRHVKSVDNALQRIKRKLDTALTEPTVVEPATALVA